MREGRESQSFDADTHIPTPQTPLMIQVPNHKPQQHTSRLTVVILLLVPRLRAEKQVAILQVLELFT